MKKLATIIALALCVTIGGVYAGWIYSQGGATGADARANLSMSTVSYDGTKGVISADTTALTILVDDMSTVADSGISEKYTAGLRGAGQISISFTAKDGADATVVQNGIPMMANISVSKVGSGRTYSYQGQELEVLKVSTDTALSQIILNGGAPSKTATISAEQIIAALVFCEGETIKLSTKAENDAFADVMSDYKIHIDIVEYTPPVNG